MDIIKLAKIFEGKIVDFGVGPKAETLTMQAPFEPTIKCAKCGREANLACTFIENFNKSESVEENQKHFIAGNEPDKDKEWWPHDVCAFAIYLCPNVKCATATARWNRINHGKSFED
jgi:hypothetical protein